MPSIEYDLRYLRAGLADLEAYLLSDELYWPIGVKPPHGDPPYPRLTPGGILLSRQSLVNRGLNADQTQEYAELTTKLDEMRLDWQTAWQAKARRSFSSRLVQWSNFMEDYRKQPENNTDRYAYEVRGRVMLQLLEPESPAVTGAELELVKGLDRVLEACLKPGAFVWDPGLSPSFPQSQFWYLYGTLTSSPPGQ